MAHEMYVAFNPCELLPVEDAIVSGAISNTLNDCENDGPESVRGLADDLSSLSLPADFCDEMRTIIDDILDQLHAAKEEAAEADRDRRNTSDDRYPPLRYLLVQNYHGTYYHPQWQQVLGHFPWVYHVPAHLCSHGPLSIFASINATSVIPVTLPSGTFHLHEYHKERGSDDNTLSRQKSVPGAGYDHNDDTTNDCVNVPDDIIGCSQHGNNRIAKDDIANSLFSANSSVSEYEREQSRRRLLRRLGYDFDLAKEEVFKSLKVRPVSYEPRTRKRRRRRKKGLSTNADIDVITETSDITLVGAATAIDAEVDGNEAAYETIPSPIAYIGRISYGHHFPHWAQQMFYTWSLILWMPLLGYDEGPTIVFESGRGSSHGWIDHIRSSILLSGWSGTMIHDYVGHRVTAIVEAYNLSIAYADHNGERSWRGLEKWFLHSSDAHLLRAFVLGYVDAPRLPRSCAKSGQDSTHETSATSNMVESFVVLNRRKSRQMKNAADVASTLRHIFKHSHSNATTTGTGSRNSNIPSDDVVFFEDLPATSQALLMSRTDLIIAPHGAGLVNIAFMRPCSIVIEVRCCCGHVCLYVNTFVRSFDLVLLIMEYFPLVALTKVVTVCYIYLP
jgi:hypothetical protein